MAMFGIPSGLVERIRSGEAVLVAGLGFHLRPSIPGWAALVRHLARAMPHEEGAIFDPRPVADDLISQGRLGPAVAFVRQRLSDTDLCRALDDVFSAGYPPSEAMSIVGHLPWHGVVTSSFHGTWDAVLGGDGRTYQAIDGAILARQGVAPAGPFVLSALGRTGAPQTLCLSATDLRRRATAGAVTAFLRDRFAERPFVFVGFRPGDPDLEFLATRVLGSTPTGAEHFLLLESVPDAGPGAAAALGADLDLTAVAFPGALPDLVRALADAVAGEAGYSRIVTPSPALAAALLQGDPSDWLRHIREEIEAAPAAEKAALWEGAGDVHRDRMGSPVQAMASYRSALALAPARQSVLQKLADLYVAHQHFRAADDVLMRLARLETNPLARAHLMERAAIIQRDELDSPVRAAQLLARALEDNPGFEAAFGALDEMLSQQGNWPLLSKLCQKILTQPPRDADGPVRRRAAQRLAVVAMEILEDQKLGLWALEASLALGSDDLAQRQRVADLCVKAGVGYENRAISHHQALLARDPDRMGSYRALADLYLAIGDRDRLHATAATLVFLRKADDDLKDLYEKGLSSRAGVTPSPLHPSIARSIAHPDEDPRASDLLAIVGRCLSSSRAEPEDVLGATDGMVLVSPRDPRPIFAAIANAATFLGLEKPVMYTNPLGGPVSYHWLRGDGPLRDAIVLTPGLAGLADPSQALFIAAVLVARLRPEARLAAVDSGTLVDIGARGALHVAGVGPGATTDREGIERFSAELRAFLSPGSDGDLTTAARAFAGNGDSPDLGRWQTGLHLSGTRLAFLLTHDLGVAARALAAEPPGLCPLPAKQRLKDLVGFSVSETYFAARKALGLSRDD